MMDLWERVSPVFTAVEGAQPEIDVENVSEKAMRYLINHMLHESKSIDLGFRSANPPHPEVTVNAPDHVAEVVLQGTIIGPLIAEMRIDGYTLPMIAMFILSTDQFFLSYQMGAHWTPVTVTALFEIFRNLKNIDSNILIRLNPEHFNGAWRVQFDMALQEYLNEHHP